MSEKQTTDKWQPLLLTTARILRDHLRETAPKLHPDVGADIMALNEVLAPFDPVSSQSVSGESAITTPPPNAASKEHEA